MSVRKIEMEPAISPRGGRWLALGALVFCGLVIGLDITVLVTALPTLSSKLGATTTELQWITAGYTLALGGLLLPGGVLGDRYGRRRFLLIGLLLFGASSLIASQVTSAAALIGMRVVMGAGAALILPLTLSILPTMFSPQERPRAVAVTTASAALGLPLGPLVAGWLLTHYSWGTVFLINAPVVVISILGVWFLVPESKDPEPHAFDWIGAFLAVFGVTALVYGVIEEPVRGWADPRVLTSIIGGALALAAFVLWDLRARSPFVDLRLFLNRSFTWATVAFVATGFAMFGVMFILTPYLQIVQGNDAQATGIKLIPLIATLAVGAIIGNQTAARLGAKFNVVTGMFLAGAGLALLSRAGADTGYGLVATALSVAGLGLGLALPTAVDVLLGVLPPAMTGAGTALTRMLQQVAGSFGVAILGSLLNAVYLGYISGRLGGLPAHAREVAQGSVAGAAAVASHLPPALGRPLIRAAHEAYAQGMSEVMLICAGMMLLGAVLIAVFFPARPSPLRE